MTARFLFSLSLAVACQATFSMPFSPNDVQTAVEMWRKQCKYDISVPSDTSKNGTARVRLTPEGSQWIWSSNAYRKRAKGTKLNPADPWDAFILHQTKVDRANAAARARYLNQTRHNLSVPEVGLIPEPIEMPADMLAALGPAPSFAEPAEPRLHTITYEDGMTLAVHDTVEMPTTYAFYRFRSGIQSFGTPMRGFDAAQMDRLMQAAQITASQRRVMEAVSLLEGGFDSINTYDTGFVSAGMIQFACLSKGAGSLGQVLLRFKLTKPAEFKKMFTQYGIDVTPEGALAALDLSSGTPKQAADAAAQIIADPRLAATFIRAGRLSTDYQAAQLSIARDLYFPGNDRIVVFSNGRTFTGVVSDVFKSEAGLATLMDSKVHTGSIGPVQGVLAQLILEKNLTTLAEASQHEHTLIGMLKHRTDFRKDTRLSQPPPAP